MPGISSLLQRMAVKPSKLSLALTGLGAAGSLGAAGYGGYRFGSNSGANRMGEVMSDQFQKANAIENADIRRSFNDFNRAENNSMRDKFRIANRAENQQIFQDAFNKGMAIGSSEMGGEALASGMSKTSALKIDAAKNILSGLKNSLRNSFNSARQLPGPLSNAMKSKGKLSDIEKETLVELLKKSAPATGASVLGLAGLSKLISD